MKKIKTSKDPFLPLTILDFIGLIITFFIIYRFYELDSVMIWLFLLWIFLFVLSLARMTFTITSISITGYLIRLRKVMLNLHALIRLTKKINRGFPSIIFSYKIVLLKEKLAQCRVLYFRLYKVLVGFWSTKYNSYGYSRCLDEFLKIEDSINKIDQEIKQIVFGNKGVL